MKRKDDMLCKRIISLVCWLLLALLQMVTPSSAQNTTVSAVHSTNVEAAAFLTLPADVTVAVGEPAVFQCGVPEGSPNLSFTFHSSHGSYVLTCPNGKVDDIVQALYGSCEVTNSELLAVWTLKGTSYSDNNAEVLCQQPGSPDGQTAVLHVYDYGANHTVLIGSLIGGFFGVLLVFGLFLFLLQRSERIQNCVGVDDTEDDTNTIIKE